MADDDAPDLSDRMDRLERKLDELLDAGQAKAAGHQETRLDRPSTVEEQVRAELERRDKEAAAKADSEAQASERQTVAERLAKLEEKAPAQPQPRRQRVMWGERK